MHVFLAFMLTRISTALGAFVRHLKVARSICRRKHVLCHIPVPTVTATMWH